MFLEVFGGIMYTITDGTIYRDNWFFMEQLFHLKTNFNRIN